MEWTRYYNEATEAVKEQHAFAPLKPRQDWGTGKADGLYMARGATWINWCNAEGRGLDLHYTHKKVLLNLNDLNLLTMTEQILPRYINSNGPLHFWKEIDWSKVRSEGYDGVHITAALIDRAMAIFFQHRVQFGLYDVESLVIWNDKIKWSVPTKIC